METHCNPPLQEERSSHENPAHNVLTRRFSPDETLHWDENDLFMNSTTRLRISPRCKKTTSQKIGRGDSAGPSARRSSDEPRATQARCHDHPALRNHFIRLEGKTQGQHRTDLCWNTRKQCGRDHWLLGLLKLPAQKGFHCTLLLTLLSRSPESVRSSEVRIGDCTLHMRQEKYFRIVLR